MTITSGIAPPWFYDGGSVGTSNPQISLQDPFVGVQIPTVSQLPLFLPYSQSAPISYMQYQNVHYRPGYMQQFTLNTQSDLEALRMTLPQCPGSNTEDAN